MDENLTPQTIVNHYDPEIKVSCIKTNEAVEKFCDVHREARTAEKEEHKKDGMYGLRSCLWNAAFGSLSAPYDPLKYEESAEALDSALDQAKLRASWLMREAFENRGHDFDAEWDLLAGVVRGQWKSRKEFKEIQEAMRKAAKEATAAKA